MEAIDNPKQALLAMSFNMNTLRTKKNFEKNIRNNNCTQNNMPSESTLNSLVLDFTQRFPIISPRNNQKTHRIQRNRGVNMVKQNNHMSPQPFMRAKQNLITIRGSPKLINKSSNQEKYEIKQSQFSPKIRTNFKFKPSDRNQKQLRRDLVVSFDRKNDENQDIYENNDDSASAKMKESLSLVMKSSNFNCKFNSKPKQNKLKILSKTKKFISEIASPNLDTILKLCRSKVSSPVSTDKSLIDMYQSGKDIASESTSNTKPSYNSPRNAPMKIKMNKIPRIAWEIRNSNFKPKPNEKSKFTKEEMMNMIKIRRESIIERYLNS